MKVQGGCFEESNVFPIWPTLLTLQLLNTNRKTGKTNIRSKTILRYNTNIRCYVYFEFTFFFFFFFCSFWTLQPAKGLHSQKYLATVHRLSISCPIITGFPGASERKPSACNAGDLGSVPGSGKSLGEGNGNPLQYSCLEKSHGRRSLVGYSPWDRKESDTTERLHFHFIIISTEGLWLNSS